MTLKSCTQFLIILASVFPSVQGVTKSLLTGNDLNKFWIETGFVYMNNYEWKSIATVTNTFTNPLIFISLPPIEGPTMFDGYPAAPRLRNIATLNGSVAFETKIYLTDDGNCSKTWYTPEDISPDLQVGWMVIETGMYSFVTATSPTAGQYFFVFQTSLYKTVSQIVAGPNLDTTPGFINTLYPSGCVGVTTNCRFLGPVDVTTLGSVTQIQSLVNDKFLFVRGVRLRKFDIMLSISTSDSADPSYYIIPPSKAETVGVIVYETPIKINCAEGVAFETFKKTGVTSTAVSFTLQYTYVFFLPGVYGMLSTYVSLTDSTNVRVFGKTFTGFSIITQEDQCLTEQTEHTTAESLTSMVVGQISDVSTDPCFIKLINPLDTKTPTSSPTAIPTFLPTPVPTRTPTRVPTSTPTTTPSSVPTAVPSSTPTSTPSSSPTAIPTSTPSSSPTATPSSSPTVVPTTVPTASPSSTPSAVPTRTPTATPSSSPTTSPSAVPTSTPTTTPSAVPTRTPTATPSSSPTATPSAVPTATPTATPSSSPTGNPTAVPTSTPTATPSSTPTATPSAVPSSSPTATPSSKPTSTPTATPTSTPTEVPTSACSATEFTVKMTRLPGR